MKILMFSGSIRAASLNLRLITLAHEIAVELGHEVNLINLGDFDLPIYDGDQEDKDGLPDDVLRLKQMIAETDVLVISTPEYNGFFPGLLKNTLDWCSRAGGGLDGRATYEGKKAIIMAASPGAGGGKRVLPRLVEQMEILRTEVVAQVSVGNADEAIDQTETAIKIKQALASLEEA
ncbi:MAG: NAD(P)H-dependent oxidoreductase [Alphaproteobacteria bacterium]|jgi:chromate reductase, NAD(P)H dehydrogenase (quinone)|nr:NAD(P)H-dependent oxidoreductase [Alphaproteobacteria bacterium]MBT4020492.1 NAD(P)H-dependent oxidoreductase [Alphaproteobacteria bacterium]MBT4965002.1 NAD(P)H-dependent oxidoreductase [Alphaproteobacteria bacterium]MBT5158255.1 NAD(P)H-dependent oxidoreductase [Alphaproteobacteria bacterium]MBT5917996.1 NAD(P)H-dependent oxidoreductase [Alphaproteobacteria bacterium]